MALTCVSTSPCMIAGGRSSVAQPASSPGERGAISSIARRARVLPLDDRPPPPGTGPRADLAALRHLPPKVLSSTSSRPGAPPKGRRTVSCSGGPNGRLLHPNRDSADDTRGGHDRARTSAVVPRL